MKEELEELGKVSLGGASEREIETEVVHVFKRAGWPRSQINQDVAISDRATDKADIVLRLDNQPTVLVEVKRHGQMRDAEAQVTRYCRLLQPSPCLAFLTDGTRWSLYFVGHSGIIPILEATIPGATDQVTATLQALAPEGVTDLKRSGVFEYLRVVEQGLQGLSEEAQRRMRPHFVATARALLMPCGVAAPENIDTQLPRHAEQKLSERSDKNGPDSNADAAQGHYDPFQPPDLSHTSVVKARFGQTEVSRWNDLLRAGVAAGVAAGYTKADFDRLLKANLREGEFTEQGYSPVAGTNLSLQGLSTNDVWPNVLKLAMKLHSEVEAVFRWQDKPKALRPGESGVLRWSP